MTRNKKLLGERVYEIAKRNGIPRITVETIIREYLSSLEESAKNGEAIVIDNIVTVSVLRNRDTREIVTRSRVSQSLKSKLVNADLESE